MDHEPKLIIKTGDHEKISSLLRLAPARIEEFLQNELDRATLVSEEEFPEEVVAMNSTVTYVDLSTKQEKTVQLVYPHEANVDEGKISILSPAGAALIGLRVGQKMKWPTPQGKEKEIQVKAVQQNK